MIRQSRLHHRARADLRQLFSWFESCESGLGWEFTTEFQALLLRIASNPEAFPIHARRTRRAVLRRFHHVVFFVIESDHVLVTGVFDGRRHPRSWTDRVREPARLFLVGAMG